MGSELKSTGASLERMIGKSVTTIATMWRGLPIIKDTNGAASIYRDNIAVHPLWSSSVVVVGSTLYGRQQTLTRASTHVSGGKSGQQGEEYNAAAHPVHWTATKTLIKHLLSPLACIQHATLSCSNRCLQTTQALAEEGKKKKKMQGQSSPHSPAIAGH